MLLTPTGLKDPHIKFQVERTFQLRVLDLPKSRFSGFKGAPHEKWPKSGARRKCPKSYQISGKNRCVRCEFVHTSASGEKRPSLDFHGGGCYSNSSLKEARANHATTGADNSNSTEDRRRHGAFKMSQTTQVPARLTIMTPAERPATATPSRLSNDRSTGHGDDD